MNGVPRDTVGCSLMGALRRAECDNWRGKYLRALNIYAPQVEYSMNKKSARDISPLHHSRKQAEVCWNDWKQLKCATASIPDSGFHTDKKSRLFSRNRQDVKCYLKFKVDDAISSPIEIPSTGFTEDSKKHVPCISNAGEAKLSGRDYCLEGIGTTSDIVGGKHTKQRNGEGGDNALPRSSNVEKDGEDEDDDSGIFQMEGLENESNAGASCLGSSCTSSTRARRWVSVDDPNWLDFSITNQDIDSMGTTRFGLSESFVPPHQMVERGCFSLGLQHELKTRLPVQI
uniref:AlNc14C174G8093 protein n=1 Tax=Albugo laibachii Nc14 TaxID=890382 RepID=F0WNT4_9STRA|nr:AlNc14C174G8093 [Albugo laibachii Nc14]|eukprot:CCA22976.1 AlNc14C174G8093 [Albugo laibachii Nc14]